MSEKYTRSFFYIGVILILSLAPVSQIIPINLIQPQTASATGGIVLNGTKTTSGSVVLPLFQITLSNFNVGTGSDRVLIVGVEANTASVSSITYGGVSLTKAVSSFTNNDAELWYLKNPSSTPANIVVTLSGPAQVVVGAYSFFGVSQANPIPTTTTNHNTIANSPTISITTAYSNSWVLDSTAINGAATLSSPTCTQRWNINVPNALNGGITGASSSTIKSSAGSVTCSWTATPGELWDDVAIEVKASAVPGAPTNPISTAISTTQLKLSWTTPSDNGGSSIIGYKIQRASTSWVDVVNNTGSTLTNYNVTSLAANSVYKFHIAAWNDVGLGTYSSNITGYTLPNSPTSLTATTISSSQINLSWTAPTGGNGTLNGYKIESSTNGGSTWSTIVANTTNTGTTYSNTGLASGTTYTYRVSALNGGGASSPSSTASATTSGTLSSWHSSTGILEPLYCGPYVIEDSSTCKNENGTNDFAWLDINDTKNKYPHVPYFVIVNPNSGPGSSLSSDYQRGIANLTKSGVIVLGYVHTSYDNGQVPYSQARNWVDEWVNWYSAKNSVMGNLGIKGIFLDEMSNNPTSGNLTYYGNLTNYIHGNLTYSIGNPGVETVPQFIGNVDDLTIAEINGSTFSSPPYLPSNHTLQGTTDDSGPDAWHTKYDKNNFSWLAYCQSNLVNKTYIQGTSVYVGLLYPLDQHGCKTGDSDPWSINPPQSWLKPLASYLNSTSVVSIIQAKDKSSGNALVSNIPIKIYQSNNLVHDGNTTFTYNATSGWQFNFTAPQSYSSYTFCNWTYGSPITNNTNHSILVTPTVNTIFNATYTKTHC